jgi:3-dehydroquinate synthase
MLERPITLTYTHRVLFTRDVFAVDNVAIGRVLAQGSQQRIPKSLVFLDSRVAAAMPHLMGQIVQFARANPEVFQLAGEVVIIPGGERCKNDFSIVQSCWQQMNDAGLDRHSYVFVIGGGAVLDLVCFAASTAHRGIRHVRFPTTTLSQGDGGVGVKNGVNFAGKKNWVGSFAVPHAIINDFCFLETLPPRERRHGLIEALKVSLIRDAAFFESMESKADALAALEPTAVEPVVRRSAELHVEHIAGCGDPFELGSARPLDFGHWAAHKLEQVSQFRIAHGEAVAIGMALDLLYSVRADILPREVALRIIALIERMGFATYAAELLENTASGESVILQGLEEFREHLGGQLTITLVPCIGSKVEVHEMNRAFILEALHELRDRGNHWTAQS